MAEYPNNSHSARERTDSTAPGKAEKKLEKVVTGAAKTRKKSEARKFVNIFVPEDGENVKSYIMMDVIIPGIKNAIADVISIVLFGDSGRIGGSRSKRDGRSRLTYWDDRRDDRREYGRPRAAAGFEYDDIIFETRGDAELVLDQLESAIANYGIASVAASDVYKTQITRPTAMAGRIFSRQRSSGPGKATPCSFRGRFRSTKRRPQPCMDI